MGFGSDGKTENYTKLRLRSLFPVTGIPTVILPIACISLTLYNKFKILEKLL